MLKPASTNMSISTYMYIKTRYVGFLEERTGVVIVNRACWPKLKLALHWRDTYHYLRL